MDKIVVSEPQFWAALDAAVDARGEDYTYPQSWRIPDPRPFRVDGALLCAYVHQTEGKRPEPGCIAGDVFHRLGAALRDLARFEGKPARYVFPRLFAIEEEAAEAVLVAIGAAQTAQDEGRSWGEARIDARQVVGAEGVAEDA